MYIHFKVLYIAVMLGIVQKRRINHANDVHLIDHFLFCDIINILGHKLAWVYRFMSNESYIDQENWNFKLKQFKKEKNSNLCVGFKNWIGEQTTMNKMSLEC